MANNKIGTKEAVKHSFEIIKVKDVLSNKAKLMFYFDCICNVVSVNILPSLKDRLRDYLNPELLSEEDLHELLVLCRSEVAPDVFINKCIFADDEKCGSCQNKFCEFEDLPENFKYSKAINFKSGTDSYVKRIMFYRNSFLEDNYFQTMRYYKWRFDRMDEKNKKSEKKEDQNSNNSSCCCSIL